MRIKSDFHDFYDCAQSFGQDQSLLYVRKKIDFPVLTELKVGKFPLPVPNVDRHRGYTRKGELPTFMRFYVVGLAGKIWPVFELVWDYSDSMSKQAVVFCYNLADIDKAIQSHCNKKVQDTYNEVDFKKSKRYRFYHMSIQREEFKDFFTRWALEDQAVKVKTLFRQYPLWAIELRHDGWYVCYNCSLKDYKFFKVMDTVTTYQEIAMFLGGLAMPQKPIPVPSDKDMVSIKGFDKYSFRKDPSKKKRK